jgi:hypothetical protein
VPPKDLPGYVKWVLDQDKNLELVAPEVREQLEKDYVAALEVEINAAVLARLTPEQILDVERLLEGHGVDAVRDHIATMVPDLDNLIAGVLLKFRNEYLEGNV